MPFLLRPALEQGALPGLICSTGPDDLSCQAEILVLFRRGLVRTECPKGDILASWSLDKETPDKWLSLFNDVDRIKIIEAKAEIKSKGFGAFHKGEVPMPKNTDGMVMSRINLMPTISADLANAAAKKLTHGSDHPIGVAMADPLQAGIHPDFPPKITEEQWIQLALGALRAWGPEKWLHRMLENMRLVFGGRAKVPIPNKNDACLCKSGKKYGKCCGMGVQEEDPEQCKLGIHNFKEGWSKAPSGKYIRGCLDCLKIEEAPYAEVINLMTLEGAPTSIPRKNYTPEQRERAIGYSQKGMTNKRIADALGLHGHVINALLNTARRTGALEKTAKIEEEIPIPTPCETEAPEKTDVVGGIPVVLIGCKTCHKAPSTADAEKLVKEWLVWYRCAVCNKAFEIQEAVIDHFVKNDLTHDAEWKIVKLTGATDVTEITFLDTLINVHPACFKRAIPYANTLGRDCKDTKEGTIVKGIGGKFRKESEEMF